MSKSRPTYQELEKRLAASEPIVDALKATKSMPSSASKRSRFLLLKEVREALVNSEAGFRAMFELSGVGMFQADFSRLPLYPGQPEVLRHRRLFRRGIADQTYIGLTHPQDRQRDMMRSKVLLAKTNSWSIDKRCVRKNGSVISVRVDGAALRDVAGRVVRILAMISDTPAGRKASASSGTKSSRKSPIKRHS